MNFDYIIVGKHSEVCFMVGMNEVNTLVVNYSRCGLRLRPDGLRVFDPVKTSQDSAKTVFICIFLLIYKVLTQPQTSHVFVFILSRTQVMQS